MDTAAITICRMVNEVAQQCKTTMEVAQGVHPM
jgi:hypothetical protein